MLHVGVGYCTTRRRKTHVTEEREVLYPWHPWFGLTVHVHQAVDKRASAGFRCSLDAGITDRWLELPAWMFDRATCVRMQIASVSRVDSSALEALQSLMADTANHGLSNAPSSNVPVPGAGREPRPPNRSDADATSRPPSQDSSPRNPSVRSVPPAGPRTAVAANPGRGPREGHEPDGTTVGRARTARSSRTTGGRASR
jgi:hypothetical protein